MDLNIWPKVLQPEEIFRIQNCLKNDHGPKVLDWETAKWGVSGDVSLESQEEAVCEYEEKKLNVIQFNPMDFDQALQICKNLGGKSFLIIQYTSISPCMAKCASIPYQSFLNAKGTH